MSLASARAVAPYHGFARIYDAVTGDAMLPAIWRAFRRACRHYRIRFSNAADLGCGTGAFLACLARADRRLYGVDRSPAMLALARQRLAGLGVTLLHQDLADLRLPEPVTLITCNGATLNYASSLAGLGRIFRRVHQNTAFGGWLIFDMILGNGRPARNGHRVQRISLPGTSARWSIRIDPSGRGSVVDMTTAGLRADGSWDVVRETHRQRWFLGDEIAGLLRKQRWTVLETSKLDGGVRSQGSGGWQQFVAKRD